HSNTRVILDKQNDYPSVERCRLPPLRLKGAHVLGTRDWQIHLDLRAATRLALHIDVTAALLDDTVDTRQPQVRIRGGAAIRQKLLLEESLSRGFVQALSG